MHPSAYTLSVDLAGPMKLRGLRQFKYLMVACYRFPRIPLTARHDPAEEERVEAQPDDGEDW